MTCFQEPFNILSKSEQMDKAVESVLELLGSVCR